MSIAPCLQPAPLRIGIVANTSWYLYNFRRNLMHALVADGHEIVALGGGGEYGRRLRAEGIEHVEVVFSASGTHPWHELATIAALRRTISRERLDLVLSYTPKGNIYSAWAIAGLRVSLVMNVSGLGMAFVRRGLLSAVVRLLYRLSLRRAAWVYFQNETDLAEFRDRGYVDMARVSRLPGSGVDLEFFRPGAQALGWQSPGSPLFLMVTRLLWEKGVGEFVEAARQVKAVHPRARFRLLGALAPGHRAGVPEATLRAWVDEGLVEYAGVVDDVRPEVEVADCVVLPSVYREGVPRSLLEAAAMAKPIIATDSVGCRDALDDGVSGFLCRPRDAADLARQMMRLLALDAASLRRMGAAGRAKMESQFDERLVIDAYRQRIRELAEFGHGNGGGR